MVAKYLTKYIQESILCVNLSRKHLKYTFRVQSSFGPRKQRIAPRDTVKQKYLSGLLSQPVPSQLHARPTSKVWSQKNKLNYCATFWVVVTSSQRSQVSTARTTNKPLLRISEQLLVKRKKLLRNWDGYLMKSGQPKLLLCVESRGYRLTGGASPVTLQGKCQTYEVHSLGSGCVPCVFIRENGDGWEAYFIR